MYATRFKDKDILNQTFFYPYPENLINIPAFDAEKLIENSSKKQICDDRSRDETLEEKDVMNMTDEELEEFEEENNRRLNHVL